MLHVTIDVPSTLRKSVQNRPPRTKTRTYMSSPLFFPFSPLFFSPLSPPPCPPPVKGRTDVCLVGGRIPHGRGGSRW